MGSIMQQLRSEGTPRSYIVQTAAQKRIQHPIQARLMLDQIEIENISQS